MNSLYGILFSKYLGVPQIFQDSVLSANFLHSATFGQVSEAIGNDMPNFLFEMADSVYISTQQDNNSNDDLIEDDVVNANEVQPVEASDSESSESVDYTQDSSQVEIRSNTDNANEGQYVRLEAKQSDARDGWDADYASVGFGNNAGVSSLERNLDISSPASMPEPVFLPPPVLSLPPVSSVEICNNLAGAQLDINFSFGYNFISETFYRWISLDFYFVDTNNNFISGYGSGSWEWIAGDNAFSFDFIMNGISGTGQFDEDAIFINWGTQGDQYFSVTGPVIGEPYYVSIDQPYGGDFSTGDGYFENLEIEAGCWDYGEYDSYSGSELFFTNTETTAPIVFDLETNGLELTEVNDGVLFDVDEDGVLEQTAWVSPSDALLIYDLGGDHRVTNVNEFAFANWHEDAITDLEGLQLVFDENQDGRLNSADSAWAKMGLWQDVNQNGLTDEGEFLSLADVGYCGNSVIAWRRGSSY